MARGFGIWGGLADGLGEARQANREDRRLELEAQRATRQNQESDLRIAKESQEQAIQAQRRAELQAAGATDSQDPGASNYQNAGDLASDGFKTRATKASPWRQAQIAGQALLSRGDMEGGQRLLESSAALRTLEFRQRLNDAIRARDPQAVLNTLTEDLPDGNKYQAGIDPKTNELVGYSVAPDGRVLGAMRFKNFDHMASHVRALGEGQDLYKFILDRTKDEVGIRKDESAARASDASAGASNATARLTNARAATEEATGMEAARAEIGQRNAAAAASSASAANAGTTPEIRNFQFAAKLPPEQRAGFGVGAGRNDPAVRDPAVVQAQKTLVDAYTDPVKRTTLTPEQIKMAESLLAGAGGRAIVLRSDLPRGAGMPAASPQRPPINDFFTR